MNKRRRKEVFKIIQNLNKLLSELDSYDVDEIVMLVQEAIDEIQLVLDEEECVRDNIPENLQNGYRYEESEDACDNLSDAICELEEIEDESSKEEIQEYISDAIKNLYLI
jgi:hypothetical protein